MKKIGIMTWYKYRNFGTALQVVALAHKIKELGYAPEVFNYFPRKIGNTSNWTVMKVVSQGITLLSKRVKKEEMKISAGRSRLFDEFISRYLAETRKANNAIELADISSAFDAVICGSDQIWAPSCFDDKFFLSFVHDAEKMISYAPSIGLPRIDNLLVADQMRLLIKRFKYLSVREQQGAELIYKLCGKKAEVVLDPTLLHGFEFWHRLTKESEVPKSFMEQAYVIAYFLGKPSRYIDVLREAQLAYGMPVYLIPVFKSQYGSKYCVPFEVGPAEFVQLLANAKYVLTDSFHGLAFSVNFNRPFTVFKRFKDDDKINQNSRILNLLSICGLLDRLKNINSYSPSTNDLQCNFGEVNKSLGNERKKSLQFLQESLVKATGRKSEIDCVNELHFCCGCGACKSQCPVQAITIQKNADGFFEKNVNADKCVHCKKCLSVCPFYGVNAMSLKNMEKLMAYKSECLENERTGSSSGAIGADLVQQLLAEGYTVSGCAYDQQHNNAMHILFDLNSRENAERIKGSKYIQSYTVSVMDAIHKHDFEKLAFFGTPCQVAAVDKLLKGNGNRDKAVLVDLICHGVPSYQLWDKYIKYINERYHTGLNPDVRFRSSTAGWRKRFISLCGNGHNYIKNEKDDLFYAFFRSSLCDMPSCYECPYREKSSADIRIGDFWGERFKNDSIGISMVSVNTSKGSQLVDKLSGWSQEYNRQEYWDVQYPYNHQPPLFYYELMRNLRNDFDDIEGLYKQYTDAFVKRERMLHLFGFVKRFIGK